ncbi:MAG: acylphosphatase [Eubacteriaceae bacterium]|nr:acylphosphatase [Eubacteriaceae bacterium]MBR0384629.1 acylphosphatase [Eubacteriaceae bacterium]
MHRYYIILRGRVQGVGLRYRTSMSAREFGLTGWVKNLSNGDVAMEVQGEKHELDAFIKSLLKNDYFIRIDDHSIKEIAPDPTDTSFKITY